MRQRVRDGRLQHCHEHLTDDRNELEAMTGGATYFALIMARSVAHDDDIRSGQAGPSGRRGVLTGNNRIVNNPAMKDADGSRHA
jgi:hypothetical protein